MVQKIAQSFPGCLNEIDIDCRLPLHIATRWGASARVVRFLIKARPEGAFTQDYFGKTPLHLTCKDYHSRFIPSYESEYPLTFKESMYRIVWALDQVAPDIVNIEDEDGRTALDYAITTQADKRVLLLLHRATMNSRNTKSNHGRRGQQQGHTMGSRVQWATPLLQLPPTKAMQNEQKYDKLSP